MESFGKVPFLFDPTPASPGFSAPYASRCRPPQPSSPAGDTTVSKLDAAPDPEINKKPHRAERPFVFPFEGSGLFPEGIAARWTLDKAIESLAGFDREDGVSADLKPDEVPVHQSFLGDQFKYYGHHTPLSQHFPVAITARGKTNWVDMATGARPMERETLPLEKVKKLRREGAGRCRCDLEAASKGKIKCEPCTYMQVP